ncbi:MAG: hydrolase [Desulfacinum sp.]|nr:hydrolase [Desulfacinum sp.]
MEAPFIPCPQCGAPVTRQRNPSLAVDIIILVQGRVVLIERRNPPLGWALPGGFVDYGESLEQAAVREAAEETCLELMELRQFRAYSDPDRDPRGHVVSVVFSAVGRGTPRAADDARKVKLFSPQALPSPLAFDHARILADYFRGVAQGEP